MLYTTFNVKDKEYKLRLNARACVDLEKKLGTNPINVFMKIAESNELPQMETIITILHATLQPFQHNMSMENTYTLFDDYVEDGHNLMDIVPVLIEVFQESGLIPKNEDEIKNA